MQGLTKLLIQFSLDNVSILAPMIVLQITYSLLESVVIPFVLAGALNSIGDFNKFRLQLIKLILIWVTIKSIGIASKHYHNQTEPVLAQYISMTLIDSVFCKYEADNHITNVSALIDKIQLIKNNLHDFSSMLFSVFIPRGIVIVISLLNFASINKTLAMVITLGIFIQFFFISLGFDKCVAPTYTEHRQKEKLYNYLEDVFTNIGTVQSVPEGYDHESKALESLSGDLMDNEKCTFKCVNTKQGMGTISNILIFSFIVYTVYRLYKNGTLDQNKTTTVMLLVIGLFENLSDLTYHLPDLMKKISVFRINDDFVSDLFGAPQRNTKTVSGPLFLQPPSIRMEDVSFSYPNRDGNTDNKQTSQLLSNYSVSLQGGKITCLTGNSGIGKTTFIKLLFGILSTSNGVIYYDDKPLEQIGKSNIRSKTAYVEQNTNSLFDRTIIDNILYGKTGDTRETDITTVKRLLEQFNLYQIYESLDSGKEKWAFLNLYAGKGGKILSGGQKKIIHMLRIALNSTSQIVILDEPSTGLDTESKSNVTDLIKYMHNQGKTVLIISHDPDICSLADYNLQFYAGQNPSLIKM